MQPDRRAVVAIFRSISGYGLPMALADIEQPVTDRPVSGLDALPPGRRCWWSSAG
jgi:hypothetical protein